MAIEKFPADVAQVVGQFWAAGEDSAVKSDGFCRVDGKEILIDVARPLTPSHAYVEITKGLEVHQVPEPDDFVVHGKIPIRPSLVSFLGAWTQTRRSELDPLSTSGDDPAPELHRIRADWCIAGAHVGSAEQKFDGFRARFTHLELWADHSGLSTTILTQTPVEVSVKFQALKDLQAPFTAFDEDATLRLGAVGTLPAPTVWGSEIRTSNRLTLEGLSGWTLSEAFSRFINPVRSLLTILAGEHCELTELQVKVGDTWCGVFGDPVNAGAERPANRPRSMLLTRDQFSLDLIGDWCTTVADLSPTPHVVAAALSGAFQTVETEALVLATTAEGLDAALHPDSRRFSEEEVKESTKALKRSDVPKRVRNELSSALGSYFYEDSYPMRMQRLAEAVTEAVPDCVGEPRRWKDAMRVLRNDLAHSNKDDSGDTQAAILSTYALSRSLRWALQIRLLQRAGVSSEGLAEAIGMSELYRRDRKHWHGLFEAPASPADESDAVS